MNCETCGGACCESITLNVVMPTDDLQRFVELRTKPIRRPDGSGFDRNFEARCRMLTPAGRCAIYVDRPHICRDFEPGSTGCIATARARRTKDQYDAIRGPEDPPWDPNEAPSTPAEPELPALVPSRPVLVPTLAVAPTPITTTEVDL